MHLRTKVETILLLAFSCFRCKGAGESESGTGTAFHYSSTTLSNKGRYIAQHIMAILGSLVYPCQGPISKFYTEITLPFRNLNLLRKSGPTKESQRQRRRPLKNTPSQFTLTECGRELTQQRATYTRNGNRYIHLSLLSLKCSYFNMNINISSNSL